MRKVLLILTALFLAGYGQVDHFHFTQTISTQTAGVWFKVYIEAHDANHNLQTSFNELVTLSTNYGPSYIQPNKVYFTSGRFGGEARDTVMVTLAKPDIKIIATWGSNITGESNVFTVNPGSPRRVQIVAPGQTPTPGIAPGKSGDAASQTAGDAFSVTINYTDSLWNLITSQNSPKITFSSTDSFANLPAAHIIVGGSDTVALTLKTASCPYRSAPILQTVKVENTDLLPDSTKIRVVPGQYVKLLHVVPGETPRPGSDTGVGGSGLVLAYRDTAVTVYEVDKCNNEVAPVNLQADSVWLWSDAPDYTSSRALMRSGGVRLQVRFNPDPGTGEVRYSVQARDMTDPTKNGLQRTIRVDRKPDGITVTASKDTIVMGEIPTLTAFVTGGGAGAPSEQIRFAILSLPNKTGDGQLGLSNTGPWADTVTRSTDENGRAVVYFSPTKPGNVGIEAYSIRGEIADTILINIGTAERISFYPNPWKRSETPTATILYTLDENVSSVTLIIADMSGNIVFKKEFKEADGDQEVLNGPHYIVWDGKNLKGEKVASGMYVIRVRATGEAPFKRNALLLP